MEIFGSTKIENNVKRSNGALKDCFREYKLQDKVDALKNSFRIKDVYPERDVRNEGKKIDTTSVKDCLQPPRRSNFQALVHELKDTVRSGYWNKEIGRTIYLPPHLPAGCDPIETTFGKATTRDGQVWIIIRKGFHPCIYIGYGVAEIINPRDFNADDLRVHEIYRKSHNDYYPSEQINRNYKFPFDKFSLFGRGKKTADFSGKKVANCVKWFNNDSMSLVSRRLADFSNRTFPRVGRNRDHEIPRLFGDLTFGKNADDLEPRVAEILNENSGSQEYCSEYTDKISKILERMREVKNIAAGIPSERTDLPHVVVPEGASIADKENLGDQTSVMAVLSPNVFTQLGLSHIEFFKIREYEEMRSIFENIGIEFSGDSFDVIWKEGLRKDCTGGVCVETFRNLLGRLAMETYKHDS